MNILLAIVMLLGSTLTGIMPLSAENSRDVFAQPNKQVVTQIKSDTSGKLVEQQGCPLYPSNGRYDPIDCSVTFRASDSRSQFASIYLSLSTEESYYNWVFVIHGEGSGTYTLDDYVGQARLATNYPIGGWFTTMGYRALWLDVAFSDYRWYTYLTVSVYKKYTSPYRYPSRRAEGGTLTNVSMTTEAPADVNVSWSSSPANTVSVADFTYNPCEQKIRGLAPKHFMWRQNTTNLPEFGGKLSATPWEDYPEYLLLWLSDFKNPKRDKDVVVEAYGKRDQHITMVFYTDGWQSLGAVAKENWCLMAYEQVWTGWDWALASKPTFIQYQYAPYQPPTRDRWWSDSSQHQGTIAVANRPGQQEQGVDFPPYCPMILGGEGSIHNCSVLVTGKGQHFFWVALEDPTTAKEFVITSGGKGTFSAYYVGWDLAWDQPLGQTLTAGAHFTLFVQADFDDNLGYLRITVRDKAPTPAPATTPEPQPAPCWWCDRA